MNFEVEGEEENNDNVNNVKIGEDDNDREVKIGDDFMLMIMKLE